MEGYLPVQANSPQNSFTGRFQLRHAPSNELLELYNIFPEDFETCDLLKWCLGQLSQFPISTVFSRYIFSVPGPLQYLLKLSIDILDRIRDCS